MASRYRLSASWRIEPHDEGFELFGGDDARFLIENSPIVARFAAGESLARPSLPQSEREIFEKLLAAGMIQPVVSPSRRGAVALVGDALPVRLDLPGSSQAEDADLLVLLRHTSTSTQTVERALTLTKPHLFVDISFHHTVSVGPFVIPHETPCVACFFGRIRERWGEREPVEEPAVALEYPELVAALVASEVRRCLQGDTFLVGRSVAWDLAGRSIAADRLLTVPMCEYCDGFEPSGAIDW